MESLESRCLLTITGFGVAGDSLSDEYVSGISDYARNWIELLGAYRTNDVPLGEYRPGPVDDWGEPRRNGYEFNWARSGATSESLLQAGQHAGLAEQINSGSVSHAVLAVGQNDFIPGFLGSAYFAIYYGLWNQTQIDEYVDGVFDNIHTALQVIDANDVKLVLSNVVDYGVAPITQQFFSDASSRQLVTNVINGLNERLAQLAQDERIPLVNMFGAAQDLIGPSSFFLGGVEFTNTGGVGVTNFFLDDNVHPHTGASALLANIFLEAFRVGYGEQIDPFTEQEITTILGLPYERDTFHLTFSDYVDLPLSPPTVTGVEINALQIDPPDLPSGPQPTSWSDQRSRVSSIVIGFSEAVLADVEDIELFNLGFDVTHDPPVRIPLAANQVQLNGNELAIHFDPNELPEGVFQLRLLPSVTNLAGVALDGNGDGAPADAFDYTGTAENRFFKLPGDWNADAGTSIFDFPVFTYWFGKTVGIAPEYADLNGDAGISIFDFPQFVSQFGRSLTFSPSLKPASGLTDNVAATSLRDHERSVDMLFGETSRDLLFARTILSGARHRVLDDDRPRMADRGEDDVERRPEREVLFLF